MLRVLCVWTADIFYKHTKQHWLDKLFCLNIDSTLKVPALTFDVLFKPNVNILGSSSNLNFISIMKAEKQRADNYSRKKKFWQSERKSALKRNKLFRSSDKIFSPWEPIPNWMNKEMPDHYLQTLFTARYSQVYKHSGGSSEKKWNNSPSKEVEVIKINLGVVERKENVWQECLAAQSKRTWH